jgi:hypothetical protein
MDLSDFDEARDPDLLSKKLWAQVPKLIRKDVEQHVTAKLSAVPAGEVARSAFPGTSYQL